MRIKLSRDARGARHAEYPPVGDQIDAIMALAKALEAQGIKLPEKTKDWISKCEQVKKKYPIRKTKLVEKT
jgi:hypothetical protein